ncbi:MAG: cold shock domain-containing protein [Proteobacteria bacterium]|nr:cold shock domain-containing protein [Pseudomonadota bacterium]
MRTYIIAATSALFLAALITELSSRLWPGSYLALLVLATVALFINGLFNTRLSGGATGGTSTNPSASPEQKRRNDRPRQPKREATRAPEPSQSNGVRENGTVKWFNRTKGFGFVIRANGDEIFVHQRSIRPIGEGDQQRRPGLRDGQAVSFEVAKRDKGLQAEDVIPTD